VIRSCWHARNQLTSITSRRSFTAIANDTRVVLAVLSRDVLSKVLCGSVDTTSLQRMSCSASGPPTAYLPSAGKLYDSGALVLRTQIFKSYHSKYGQSLTFPLLQYIPFIHCDFVCCFIRFFPQIFLGPNRNRCSRSDRDFRLLAASSISS
jgi:hypothetical protein